MERHADLRADPDSAAAGCSTGHQRAHGLPAGRGRIRLAAARAESPRRAGRRRWSRSTRAAATTTRCCASGCSRWRRGSKPRSGAADTACRPTRRRCSRWSWRAQAGIGWRGKHTLLLAAGCRLDVLPRRDPDRPAAAGRCAGRRATAAAAARCIDICPTRAITAPYQLDARRCISYLTIEHPGPIPLELRPLIGNRIYGCDDCQLVCPWNKFAQRSHAARLRCRDMVSTAQRWSNCSPGAPMTSTRYTAGSAIRRIGHERWLRNIAVALGNAEATPAGGRGVAGTVGRCELAGTRACRVGPRAARDRNGRQRRGQRGARLIASGNVTIASSVCTVIAYATGVAWPPMRAARM